MWLSEHEILDDARQGIGGYIDRYHHRPHSGLNYRTPTEVRPDLGGWTTTTENRGLTCQHRRGAGHDCSRRIRVEHYRFPKLQTLLPRKLSGVTSRTAAA